MTSLTRPTQAGTDALALDLASMSRVNQIETILTLPNRVDEMSYDDNGNLTRQVLGAGSDSEIVQTWEYEPLFSNPLTETDGDGFTTIYTYDDFGGLISMTDPEGETETLVLNVIGKVDSMTDRNGNISEYFYDPITFNVIEEIAPDTSVTQYGYDANGNIAELTLAAGTAAERTIVRAYDELDRMLYEETQDSLGFSEDGRMFYAYDAFGNMVSMTDETGEESTYIYDGMNDLVSNSIPGYGTYSYTCLLYTSPSPRDRG